MSEPTKLTPEREAEIRAIGMEEVEKAVTACWRAGCDEKDGVRRIRGIIMRLVSTLLERSVLPTGEAVTDWVRLFCKEKGYVPPKEMTWKYALDVLWEQVDQRVREAEAAAFEQAANICDREWVSPALCAERIRELVSPEGASVLEAAVADRVRKARQEQRVRSASWVLYRCGSEGEWIAEEILNDDCDEAINDMVVQETVQKLVRS